MTKHAHLHNDNAHVECNENSSENGIINIISVTDTNNTNNTNYLVYNAVIT